MNLTVDFAGPARHPASAQLASMLRYQGPRFVEYARCANPEIPRLEKLLADVEARLGTAAERSNDFVECRDLAHRLSSLFCIGAMIDYTPLPRPLHADSANQWLGS